MCPEERRTTLFTRLSLRQGSRQDTPSPTTWTASSRKALAGWTWRSIKVKILRHYWIFEWSNTENTELLKLWFVLQTTSGSERWSFSGPMTRNWLDFATDSSAVFVVEYLQGRGGAQPAPIWDLHWVDPIWRQRCAAWPLRSCLMADELWGWSTCRTDRPRG